MHFQRAGRVLAEATREEEGRHARSGGGRWVEVADEPQSKPGQMKVGKGRSRPEVAAAAFLILEAWFWVNHFNPGF